MPKFDNVLQYIEGVSNFEILDCTKVLTHTHTHTSDNTRKKKKYIQSLLKLASFLKNEIVFAFLQQKKIQPFEGANIFPTTSISKVMNFLHLLSS